MEYGGFILIFPAIAVITASFKKGLPIAPYGTK